MLGNRMAYLDHGLSIWKFTIAVTAHICEIDAALCVPCLNTAANLHIHGKIDVRISGSLTPGHAVRLAAKE